MFVSWFAAWLDLLCGDSELTPEEYLDSTVVARVVSRREVGGGKAFIAFVFFCFRTSFCVGVNLLLLRWVLLMVGQALMEIRQRG